MHGPSDQVFSRAEIPPKREIVIQADGGLHDYWKDVWNFRELLYILAWRDILVRYKQTAIGPFWGMLNPLFKILVFTFVFGKIAKLPSDGVPYPILVLAGLLPWQFFSSSLFALNESLLNHAAMISKTYFPRIIIPISATGVYLLDFFISSAILFALMAWYGFFPEIRVFHFLFFVFLLLTISMGIGFWFSALSVRYRDARYVVPVLLQFGLYISPVGFTSAVVPEPFRFIYSLNPMVGIIDGFRWSLLGQHRLDLQSISISIFFSLLFFFTGIVFFRNQELYFADVI
mgnify:CR=1 FL=1